MAGRLAAVGAALAAAVLVLLAHIAPAAAETTLGSGLTANDGTFFGGTHITAYQADAPAEQLTAPADGRISSWSVRSGDTNAEHELRILRPGGGEAFTAAGTSAPQTVTDSQDKVRGPFAVDLPVKAGDRIGLYVIKGSGAPTDGTGVSSSETLNYITPTTPTPRTATKPARSPARAASAPWAAC